MTAPSRTREDWLTEAAGLIADDMRAHAANCVDNMRRHSGTMREMFKGERDFWLNQLKVKG